MDRAASTDVHVLLVGPQPISREILASALRYCGAHILEAASAAQAVELAGILRPDVIVTDVAMPGQDGFWLLAQIRERMSELRGVPIMALAEQGGPQVRQRVMQAGFQAFLIKPIDPHVLCELVAELARGRRSAERGRP